MNKKAFVDALSERVGLTKKDTRVILDQFLKTVEQGLLEEGRVAFSGFGSYTVQERDARDGTNPQTGEPLRIDAHKVVQFKPGQPLKDLINGR